MLLKLPDVAPLLGLSRAGVYRLAARDALPGLRRLGARQFRVSAPELDAYIRGGGGAAASPPDQPRAA